MISLLAGSQNFDVFIYENKEPPHSNPEVSSEKVNPKTFSHRVCNV